MINDTNINEAIQRTPRKDGWWLTGRLVRLLHRLYARTMGYFWLPCPVCREWMGGHEWRDTYVGVTTQTPGLTRGVCDHCAEKYKSQYPPESLIHINPETLESERWGSRIFSLPNADGLGRRTLDADSK